MTVRTMGPLAGLEWLRRGLACARRNPRAIVAGAGALVAAALMPAVLQSVLLAMLRPGEEGALAIAALTTLVSVALLAPLMGGYLQLIHASEQGRAVHARDIFAPFASRHDAQPLIVFVLVLLLAHLLAVSMLSGLFHDAAQQLQEWMAQVMQISQQAQQSGQGRPVQLPPPPQGLGGFLGLSSLLALFLGGVFAVGLGQIALGGRSVGGALADGFRGIVRNLLPLLVLALLGFGLMLAASLVAAIVVVILSLLASLLHPALALAALLPLYLLFLTALHVVLFGVMYHLWRDVAGATPAAPPPGSIEV